jgi:glucokinase
MSAEDAAAPLVIGVDVGGTKIAAGHRDSSGELVPLGVLPTVPFDGDANARSVLELVGRADADHAIVGLSVATTVTAKGVLRDPRGWFGWRGEDPANRLRLAGVDAVTIADAEAGAVGEHRRGAGVGAQDLLYVTVGTGISHCVIRSGVPIRGAHASATFSGYMVPARCTWADCSARIVEDIASGPAIGRAWGGPDERDARRVFAAAAEGDARASDVIAHATWHLGALLADLVVTNDPDRIVIGGGLGSGAHGYRHEAVAVMRDWIHPEHLRTVPVEAAALGSSSCWVGAIDIATDVLVSSRARRPTPTSTSEGVPA